MRCSRREQELLVQSLERDRTNDEYVRMSHIKHLRTQADISRRDSLKNRLDDLNRSVAQARIQLRNLSALQMAGVHEKSGA